MERYRVPELVSCVGGLSQGMSYPQFVASKRTEDARLRMEFEEKARRQEAAQAQRLIDDFLVTARVEGLTPVPLRAQLMDGHEARTDKRGWYLNAQHSLAIGENGEYYHLVVPGGAVERLRGVKLHPSLPPMHIGQGGRDGETGDLKEFLTWLIDRR